MSFPRYEKYKDSGVEWLGEVPEGWEVVPLKRGFEVRLGKMLRPESASPEDQLLPYLRAANIQWAGVDVSDIKLMWFSPAERDSLLLQVGDLLVSEGGDVGRASMWAGELEECYFQNSVNRVRPLEGNNARFLYYWISAIKDKGYIDVLCNKSTIAHFTAEKVQAVPVPFPPLPEQRTIAAFLDHETGKIDALVAEQEKLIGLLKEKRQAVISHAVTKGLDPNARMKDSGVEWLGEVPEGWKVERGRFLYKQLDILPDEDDGVVTAFRDGQVTLRENRRTDGFTMAILEVGYQKVREGDLVIHGMDAFAGAIGVSESTGKCTPEYSVLTPLNDETANGYFAHALRIMANRNFIFVICPSVRERAPRFRFSSFKDVELPVPPALEQKKIIFHINKEISKIDTLIEEAKKAIELMKERRTALISAAVTGKIDVRGWRQSN